MHWYRIGIMSMLAGLILLSFPATAVSSGTANERSVIIGDDVPGVSDYLARMQRDGREYVLVQTDTKKPPTIDMSAASREGEVPTGKKSPLKAFLYSMVIPGAGQLYTGSKWKAALFFGLESLCWTGHITYQGKGDDKTDEFENFADIHWSEGRYGDFLFRNWGVRDDDLVINEVTGGPYFTHHLPDSRTQQYYEMIGKYDQFVFGWDDVDTVLYPPIPENLGSAYSANRQTYEDMRHEANKLYDRATAALIAAMANHLISGAEAALAARARNKKVESLGQRISLRATTARIDDSYFPMLSVSYTF